MSKLNWENLDRIFKACLLDNQNPEDLEKIKVLEEMESLEAIAAAAKDFGIIIVEGISQSCGLVLERLELHRAEIVEMIQELHPNFLAEQGGGWSFGFLAMDAENKQWAEHWQADLFFSLAAGLGLAKFCLEDREQWSMLPGGLPYVVFHA